MSFARITFRTAGIIGLLSILPMYFQSGTPLYFAAMAGIVAWQPVFFLIGSDPARYRSLIFPAVLEKWGWVLTLAVLFVRGQATAMDVVMFTPFSVILGAFFLIARSRLTAELSMNVATDKHR